MKNSQKLAISYAIRKKNLKKAEQFIIEKEGNLNEFKKSKYKSMFYYILNKYGVRIY